MIIENEALKKENIELKKRLQAVYAAPVTSDNAELLKAKISALEDEISHLNSIANNDGTNSGFPTSQMPIGKKKVVPNSRVKTGKKKGGRQGTKNTLSPHLQITRSTRSSITLLKNVPNALES